MKTQANLQRTAAASLQRSLPTVLTLVLIGAIYPRQSISQTIDWTIPQEAAPLVSLFGYDDAEFVIGGVTTKWALDANNDDHRWLIWPYIDSLGLNLFWFADNLSGVAEFYNSSLRRPGDHRMWVNGSKKLEHSTYSKEIRFYPFDSVQSPYYTWMMLNRDGGTTDTNLAELNDLGNPVLEQVYENLADTGLVASTLVLDYLPQRDTARDLQLKRFAIWFRDHRAWDLFSSTEPRTYYTSLIGHLFPAGWPPTPTRS